MVDRIGSIKKSRMSTKEKVHLGTESSLNFHQVDGEVFERTHYRFVKTKNRPHFFWGNYMIFNEPPSVDGFQNWIDHYNLEFNSQEQGFITITWSCSDLGNPQKFLDFGFEIETQEVLRLKNITKPDKLNKHVEVRVIESDFDWNQVKKTQWIKNWPLKQDQEHFLENKIHTYKRLQDQGFGYRYGAFLGEKLVGDLGIYIKNRIARFNNVFTHCDFYNQGICRSLVYGSLKDILAKNLADEFIMQATESEYAKNIYKKIGFEVCEQSHDMTWMSDKWKEK